MDVKEMQALIDRVAKTGERHELANGIFLALGADLIEEQKRWEDGDAAKTQTFEPSTVYWWGDFAVEADAEELASSY